MEGSARGERLPDGGGDGRITLRRWVPGDEEALHAVILANIEHLRPRMAWIAGEPRTIADRRLLLRGWHVHWAVGGDAVYAVRCDGEVVGSAGLHRRLGPGALEFGYWVGSAHQNQGIGTAVGRILTEVSFSESDVDRVEIHHDATNLASGRVPAKLGFTRGPDLVGVTRELAPADSGTDRVWRMTREEWLLRQQGSSSGGHRLR